MVNSDYGEGGVDQKTMDYVQPIGDDRTHFSHKHRTQHLQTNNGENKNGALTSDSLPSVI